jgi:hypothetical protein
VDQIVLAENGFNLCLELLFWITILIFQLHLNITLELVELGEDSYHGDFEKSCQSQVKRVMYERTVLIRAYMLKMPEI